MHKKQQRTIWLWNNFDTLMLFYNKSSNIFDSLGWVFTESLCKNNLITLKLLCFNTWKLLTTNLFSWPLSDGGSSAASNFSHTHPGGPRNRVLVTSSLKSTPNDPTYIYFHAFKNVRLYKIKTHDFKQIPKRRIMVFYSPFHRWWFTPDRSLKKTPN